MDLKALANSLAGAADINPASYGMVNDTTTNAPEMGNIRNMAALLAGGDVAAQSSAAMGAGANERAAQDEAARRAAAQRARAELEAKEAEIKHMQDPKNYKAIVNDVGGYDFYDPLGNKIPAVDYARAKNIRITDVYKDSQDPIDKDFIEDYDRVDKLGRAMQSGDVELRDKVFEDSPEFKEKYQNWTYADIVKDLHRAYPGYFRGDQELQRNLGKPNDLASAKGGTGIRDKIGGWLKGFMD